MKETQLTARDGQLTVIEGGSYAVAPAVFSFVEVQQMAQAIVQGGLFPHLKTPQAAISLMLLCQAEGLHPMQAIQRYHIVQGRPVMRADAMQAAFQKAGGKVEWIERTPTRAAAIFSHPQGGELEVEWTIEQATKANLTGKDVWRQHPRQMLSARVIGEGVRALYPGVCMGLYTPEEAENMPPVKPSAVGRPSAFLPEEVPAALPAAPKTPPLKRFIERASQLPLNPPAVTPDGKLSKAGALPLLCEIHGTNVTTLPAPEDHAAWEGHLAALLAVYPDAPASRPQPPIEELSDPFADEGDS